MAKEQKGLEGPFLPNIACTLLHLVRCDVFLMSGDPPEMPEGIFELAGVVAVNLIVLGVAQAGEGGRRVAFAVTSIAAPLKARSPGSDCGIVKPHPPHL